MILAKLIRLDDQLFSETILYAHCGVLIQVEDNMRHIVSATGLCLLCAWPSADAGDTQESYPPSSQEPGLVHVHMDHVTCSGRLFPLSAL